MHLDFDPTLDARTIERDAAALNDTALSYPFRRYARLWLKSDYIDYVRQSRRASGRGRGRRTVTDDVQTAYEAVAGRQDVEVGETQFADTQLPSRGMQVHPEYTL